MFKKGNRLFAVSNILLIVVAILHVYATLLQPPDDATLKIIETMKSYTFQWNGLSWNINDVFNGILLSMTLFFLFVIVLNFYIMYSSVSSTTCRHIILIDTIFMWLLTAVYGFYQLGPPLLSFILLDIFFTTTYFATIKSSKA